MSKLGDTGLTDTVTEEPSKSVKATNCLVTAKKGKTSKAVLGKHDIAVKEPPKQRATFKSYMISQATSGSSRSSPPARSSPPTSTHPSDRTGFTPEPDIEPEPDTIDTKCPLCGSEVGFLALEIFQGECKGTRPTFREQQNFCAKHKRKEAEGIWVERGYPNIDWDGIPDRLSKYHTNIKRILAKPQESHFRREMDKRAKQGNARTLRQQMEKEGFDGVSLGYYGTRGLGLMYVDSIPPFVQGFDSL
jgi:hypothetical protein